VVDKLRLTSGIVWPMPICFDANEERAKSVKVGDKVALREAEGHLLAIMTIDSIYKPDKLKESKQCYAGNGDPKDVKHHAIKYLFNKLGDWYIGGSLRGAALPTHYDFMEYRLTPKELRDKITKLCWTNTIGFQTRNPMHRSHREITLRAAQECGANILIHPTVGMTKAGDVDHFTRVRCYIEILKTYPKGLATLSLLPIAMRMAGPREALWHAIIRKNYGCTHFIVGRDHAGPGNGADGKAFYGIYDAQELVAKYQEEIGVKMVKFASVMFVEDKQCYMTEDEVPEGSRTLNISGTELRRRLYNGIPIPSWFSYPSVVEILQQTYPPRRKSGFTIFFTGLSGAGKSTIANALQTALLEDGSRPVFLLDGDHVRTHLSTELGFSKEHRDLNIKRIGYVASVITRSRAIAICAAIAPYRGVRQYVRDLISCEGGFVMVHISTPIEVCEERDVKGLYARARAGKISNFTGIDDPYEPPVESEINIDTSKDSVRLAVHKIILYLEKEGYLGREPVAERVAAA